MGNNAGARPKVLIVEDNEAMSSLLKEAFEQEGFEAACADAQDQALRIFARESFDLALLDVSLREGSGLGVCRGIRSHPSRSTTPVIVLSADSGSRSKEDLFGAGADNYLTKPIVVREVLLWARALLRRARSDWGSDSVVHSGDLSVNSATRTVERAGVVVRGLTSTEFQLLSELARARPRTVSRQDLERRLWGGERRTNTLDVHVKNLRRKLGLEAAHHLVTVKGVGFRFE